jgi:hypothetical protein
MRSRAMAPSGRLELCPTAARARDPHVRVARAAPASSAKGPVAGAAARREEVARTLVGARAGQVGFAAGEDDLFLRPWTPSPSGWQGAQPRPVWPSVSANRR